MIGAVLAFSLFVLPIRVAFPMDASVPGSELVYPDSAIEEDGTTSFVVGEILPEAPFDPESLPPDYQPENADVPPPPTPPHLEEGDEPR